MLFLPLVGMDSRVVFTALTVSVTGLLAWRRSRASDLVGADAASEAHPIKENMELYASHITPACLAAGHPPLTLYSMLTAARLHVQVLGRRPCVLGVARARDRG